MLTNKDLQLLSDCSRELQSLTASEDPLTTLSTYGSITNPLAKRRPNVNRRPAPPPTSHLKTKVETKPNPHQDPPKPKTEPKSQPSTANEFFAKSNTSSKLNPTSGSGTASSKESTPAPPALRKESSSLFKSFAKAKPKTKREDTGTGTDSEVQDEAMKEVSDDEEDYVLPAPVKREGEDSDRKNRREREAALKKMMEDDDNEATDSPKQESEAEAEEDAEVLEEKRPLKEEEPVVEVSGGKRRGRRKVMKKKTVQDEEGYLGMLTLIDCLMSRLEC